MKFFNWGPSPDTIKKEEMARKAMIAAAHRLTATIPNVEAPTKQTAEPEWDYRDWLIKRIIDEEQRNAQTITDLRKAYAEEYASDRRVYRFQCKRWGDFLSVEIGRLARAGTDNETFEQLVTSINLGQTPTITLHPGRPPTTEESARGYWIHTAPSGRGFDHWLQPPNEPGKVFFVGSNMPGSTGAPLYSARPVIFTSSTWDGMSDSVIGRQIPEMGHWGATQLTLPEEVWERIGAPGGRFSLPLPAVDDHIEFANSQVIIPTPHGLGPDVYEIIMKAIAGSSEVLDDDPEHGTLLVDGASTNLLVRCPSTGKATLMRVPPYMRTAAEARAWTFGLTPEEFTPSHET